MSFVSSAVFWGIIIIIIGVSIILREVFHIHFPFMRVLFGLLLIFWGLKVLTGRSWKSRHQDSAVLSSANWNYDESKQEYNIIFGRGNVDLFKTEMPTKNKKIEMNVVFGNGNLILNDSIPARVELNSVFGRVHAQGHQSGAFGSSVYTTTAFKQDEPHFQVEANAVFGNINIESKKW